MGHGRNGAAHARPLTGARDGALATSSLARARLSWAISRAACLKPGRRAASAASPSRFRPVAPCAACGAASGRPVPVCRSECLRPGAWRTGGGEAESGALVPAGGTLDTRPVAATPDALAADAAGRCGGGVPDAGAAGWCGLGDVGGTRGFSGASGLKVE